MWILNIFSLLKVYTASQYVVDSAGQRVCVGSISELWEKLERTKLELKVEEERGDALEEEREAAERKIALLERRLEEKLGRERKVEEDEGHKEVFSSSRPSSRVGTLEAECGALRSSLQDIASMVAGEVEGRKPRVLVPGRSSLTPRYFPASISTSQNVNPSKNSHLFTWQQNFFIRRSKSADPSAPEVTVSAVQAVLNAKQTRLVELNSKVQGLEAQLSTTAASLLSWETRAREAERELVSATNSLASTSREREEAKLKCESLRARLEKGEEASRGITFAFL